MDNGSLSLKVEHIGSDHVICEVMSDVKLGERKNCNLSGVKVDLFRAAVPTRASVKPDNII